MGIFVDGQNIQLAETTEKHIPLAISLEHEHQNFIGSFDRAGHQAYMHDPNKLHLSIIDKSNDQFVGFILLNDIQSPHRRIEYKRFVVGIPRNGYGREAIRLAKKLCFESLNAHSLWLDVFDDNSKAIRLYESEGFVLEGTKRECHLDERGFRSWRFYSMLDSEYQSIK